MSEIRKKSEITKKMLPLQLFTAVLLIVVSITALVLNTKSVGGTSKGAMVFLIIMLLLGVIIAALSVVPKTAELIRKKL